MRLPEHLELLVTDEPVFDLYAHGPWRVPDGLYDEVRDRVRALAADPRARELTSGGNHPLLVEPGPLVLGDLLLTLDFLCGSAAVNSGSHSRLQFQFFNEFLREPQDALRPPGGWGVTTGVFRPLEWLEEAPDQDVALALSRASLDVLEGVEPLERRRRALIALYDDPPPALDIAGQSLDEQRRLWAAHASDEIVAVLPELAGPIGYLEWICAGLLPLHEHLVQVAPREEPVAELVVHLLAQAGLTEVPAELSAVLDEDGYQDVLERFAKTRPLFDANEWYLGARSWLARALGAGEADACRGWLDMAMRFTGAVQGFPDEVGYPDPEWIPVGEFQADLRRLATPRRRVVNPLAATVGKKAPRTRRPRTPDFASALVGQPELAAAVARVAAEPDRPVRLMIVGPDGTGKRDAAQEIAHLLADRQIAAETLWLAGDFFAGKEVSAATTHLYNDARDSAGQRLMVIDGLDDMSRDPRSGEAIVEELHRALDVRDDLHVVALCEPGGDERVREINPALSLRFQVVRTHPFTADGHAELFARALYQRGARAHKHALTAAGRLLAQTAPVRNLRNARLAQRLADVIVDAVRERTPEGEELVVKRADVPATFDPSGSPKDPMAELNALVGLRTVKQEIELQTAGLAAARLRREAGLAVPVPARHMLFTGDPGTGKTVVARLLARIYKDLGVLSSGHLVEVGRGDLVGQYLGETAQKTRATVQRAVGGVLFIDEAYALTQSDLGEDYGAEAIAELVKALEDHRDDLVVIAAGYEADMARFASANPGLASRFPTTVRFPDFTDAELVDIFTGMAGQAGLEATAEARARVAELLRRAPRGRAFGNARLMRNLAERAAVRQARRVAGLKRPSAEALGALLAEDVPASLSGVTRDTPPADPLAELDALVGLRGVKEEVRRLVAEAGSADLRRAAGQPAAAPTRHLVLTGNPGTAKTTVARLVAAVYAKLGLLSSGHLVEVQRGDLVAHYLGQTAGKVRAAVEQAVGGVLFIDEAYALAADGYGQEAVATLVKLMEEYRGDLVVIAAGYERQMTAFLAGNPGLESRFARRIAFPDYTDGELVEIFARLAAAEGLTLADDLPGALRALLARVPRGPAFGNGRLMRNVLDETIAAQASRLLAGDPPAAAEITVLRAADLPSRAGGLEEHVGQYL
ncbi:AAA family ATPase [Actinomadura parmotrematis]|uniref:AAA family ATPase n=1 Tax=Actinomadura parmotrematis TaxID=2864039 RepID=A0ABS7G0V2_9ACTN|nr:AAA family ATPase [Actinomadura parmotrematis]MBW8485835.1 AAA family ATPase [Actinomadura parmotrematis]